MIADDWKLVMLRRDRPVVTLSDRDAELIRAQAEAARERKARIEAEHALALHDPAFALRLDARRVAGVAVLLLAGLCHAGPEDAAVRVRRAHDGVTDSGSGTVVWSAGGESLVLTNHHVCPAGGRITVDRDGASYPAEFVRSDAGLDLALLRVRAELPAAAVADRDPAPGTELRQWGHTGGGPRNPKRGPAQGVDGRRAVPGGGLVFRVGLPAESGDSGCGVFDPAGRLVAVCWGGGGSGRACCVTRADVAAFLAGGR